MDKEILELSICKRIVGGENSQRGGSVHLLDNGTIGKQ